MQSELGRSFATIVRYAEYLQNLVQSEPFAKFSLPSTAKQVITFLRGPAEPKVRLPIEQDGVSILAFTGSEVLAAYVPSLKGPVFMSLLERTFGTHITTPNPGHGSKVCLGIGAFCMRGEVLPNPIERTNSGLRPPWAAHVKR